MSCAFIPKQPFHVWVRQGEKLDLFDKLNLSRNTNIFQENQ